MKTIIPTKNTKLPGGKPCKLGVPVEVQDYEAAHMVRNGWATYATEAVVPESEEIATVSTEEKAEQPPEAAPRKRGRPRKEESEK